MVKKNLVYIRYVSTVPSGHWTMFKLRIPGNTPASSATAFTLAVSPSSSMWKVKKLLGFLIQLCHLAKKNDFYVFKVRLLEVVPTSRTLPTLPW